LTEAIKARLLGLAGEGTDLNRRHRLYIDIVPGGLPFLRQKSLWHPAPLNRSLVNFQIDVLDVVDVVVSKLKRFNANDKSDIEAMVSKDLVPHDALIDCFREAVDFTMDAKASDVPRYVRNLHGVERDLFDVEPTEIELPSWIENA